MGPFQPLQRANARSTCSHSDAVTRPWQARRVLSVASSATRLPESPSSLTQHHVHTDLGDVVMHRTHPLARLDRPLTGADLVGHAWVTSPPGTVCRQWVRRLYADVPQHLDVRHLTDDFATQLSLVASGQVLALIPRLARPPVGEGLVSRPLQRPPKREVHAAWRHSANASPAIQAVLAELLEL
jgi:DNA-binding transcriptional LysR family regulator